MLIHFHVYGCNMWNIYLLFYLRFRTECSVKLHLLSALNRLNYKTKISGASFAICFCYTKWTVIYVHAHVTNLCLNFQITTINKKIRSSSNLFIYLCHLTWTIILSHRRFAAGLCFWMHHQIVKLILINTPFPLATCFGPIQAM